MAVATDVGSARRFRGPGEAGVGRRHGLPARPTEPAQCHPRDHASRSRSFPTPRTWEFAARLGALGQVVGVGEDAIRIAVAGAIGDATAHEFLAWKANLDLPDPHRLLDGAETIDFSTLRPDRIYVVLQSLVAVTASDDGTDDRWTTAVTLCCQAADEAGIDPAVPAIRALVAPEQRPYGVAVPREIAVFGPALAMAGLL